MFGDTSLVLLLNKTLWQKHWHQTKQHVGAVLCVVPFKLQNQPSPDHISAQSKNG
uniref:Uncharacterized protein n=1 Tax=Arundo donax TaxID=35708 RepID=A0A0A9DP83_ARUDO